jgi:hypothetical protein
MRLLHYPYAENTTNQISVRDTLILYYEVYNGKVRESSRIG